MNGQKKTVRADQGACVRPSPCGADCGECGRFPGLCAECSRIEGKVWWLQYTGAPVCPVYGCCVLGKGLQNCGGCAELPCARFVKDPTVSDEQNAANLKKMLLRLKKQP